MQNDTLIILGAGGHAKGLIEIIQAQGIHQIHGITSPDFKEKPTGLLGIPVIGDDSLIPELRVSGIEHYIVGMGAVGNNAGRQRLFELGLHHDMHPVAVVHPLAMVAPSAEILAGAAVFAGSIIGPSCHIGHNVIVNHGAMIDHDCTVQDHAHIAPRACLCGDVSIGSGVHIGAGATVIQGISIGEHAFVAAGAVVVADVEPGSMVMGIPARVRTV